MSMFMRVALALVIIGALNWGLIGFFSFDLVATIFGGQNTLLAKIIYAVVGLSGLAAIALLFRSDEDVEVTHRADRDISRKMDYSTEFGEEPDFTEVRKDTKDDHKKL